MSYRDLNHVNCGCANEKCLIGIRFDTVPNILIFQDKHGNDYHMKLTFENTKQLIKELKQIKFTNE